MSFTLSDTGSKSPLAIIFDMDGVLVDSYEAHFESWQIVSTEEGIACTREQFDETFGQTSRDIIIRLWIAAGLPVPDPEIVQSIDDRKEEAYRKILQQHFPAMPGAVDLIRALHTDGFRLAVGSSGPPENIELALRGLGEMGRFETAITGRDVSRGKPDPEVFQLAATRLNVPPECCAVIEDAPHGIDAARAAGMAAIGLVSSGRTHDELSHADLVVDHLSELTPQRITGLIRAQAQESS